MKYLVCSLLCFALSTALWAQQPAQYSSYMLDPLRYNPAYAGLDYALSFTGTYRQQWAGLPGAPTGQRLSAHMPLYFLSGGFGLQVENDEIGAHRLSGVQGSYNYQLELGSGVLSLGLGAGWQQWTLNGNELITPEGTYVEPGNFNHNDDILTLNTEAGTGLQINTGLFYQSERFDVGLSAENLTRTSYQLTRFNYSTAPTYNAFVQARFELSRTVLLRPSAWFRTDATENQLDVSVIAEYNDNLLVGASFRGYSNATQDAAVIMAGFRLAPNLRLIYAYDLGLSALRTAHNGSHELVVKYQINKSFGAGVPPPIIYHPRAK